MTKFARIYVNKSRKMGQTEVMAKTIIQNLPLFTQKNAQFMQDSQGINLIFMKNRIPRDTMINRAKHDQSRKSQHKIIIPTKTGDDLTWN